MAPRAIGLKANFVCNVFTPIPILQSGHNAKYGVRRLSIGLAVRAIPKSGFMMRIINQLALHG